jgi:hypothetical protein
MMKRFSFLATLFGFGALAKAQRPLGADFERGGQVGGPFGGPNVPGTEFAWSRHPPDNNQCPVCGTMAKPLHYRNGLIFQSNIGASLEPGLIRCFRCNNAFWQDPE